jgi:hypothetical protein
MFVRKHAKSRNGIYPHREAEINACPSGIARLVVVSAVWVQI